METITIPLGSGYGASKHAFDRDELATAILLRMDHDDLRTRALLVAEHNIDPQVALWLVPAARVCIERGIEP